MKKLTHSESEIVKSVNELEEENAKLKKMYANLALDNEILREVIEKKTLVPEARKEIAGEIAGEFQISITRACNLMGIHKSYFYYESTKDDSEIEAAIRQKAEDGYDGFWKIYHRLRNEGHEWNHKRVYRVYKAIRFNKRVPLRKRLPARVKNPLLTPERENVTWSMDFVTDVLQSNRMFRVLNIIDDCDRVAVAQKIAPSMPAKRVIRFLEEIIWEKGKPNNIRCDNGPEFISNEFRDWCRGNGINIMFTQPGCPTQNSYIERFNGLIIPTYFEPSVRC